PAWTMAREWCSCWSPCSEPGIAKEPMIVKPLIRAIGLAALMFAPEFVAAGSQTLRGHVPAVLRQLQPMGRLDAERRLDLSITLPLRDQVGLSNLLAQIYDPVSTNFHRYLTPEQFTARFGP